MKKNTWKKKEQEKSWLISSQPQQPQDQQPDQPIVQQQTVAVAPTQQTPQQLASEQETIPKKKVC